MLGQLLKHFSSAAITMGIQFYLVSHWKRSKPEAVQAAPGPQPWNGPAPLDPLVPRLPASWGQHLLVSLAPRPTINGHCGITQLPGV